MRIDGLSPRMLQVIVLVGRDRMSYKRAGKCLGISAETVREHAEKARDRIESDLPPRDALTKLYFENRAELTEKVGA